jgi:hypothetical protein
VSRVELSNGNELGPDELRVEFAGEWYNLQPGQTFIIGREGDLQVDDNPYLHRNFLRLQFASGMWWLTNDGSRLAATLSDVDGRAQSWLAPGAQVPVVFGQMCLTFAAGSTTYEVYLFCGGAAFLPSIGSLAAHGDSTIGVVPLTPTQKLLILALAETRLSRIGSGAVEVPSSSAAASRLGWSLTRFTRKLDNVCEKFDRIGVEGLRGGSDGYAVNRRVRLVEYAVTSLLITAEDLPLLDAEAAANRNEGLK